MIDNDANASYWDKMHGAVMYGLEDYLRDPELDMHVYLSSEERGQFSLRDAFILKMTGEEKYFDLVKNYALYLLRESMVRERYEGHRYTGSMTESQRADFKNKGSFSCQWFIRIAELISGEGSADPPVAPAEIVQYFKDAHPVAHNIKANFNNYSFVWLAFDDYRGFIDMYEQFFLPGSKFEKHCSRKTKAIYKFCRSITLDDQRGCQKAISTFYEKSRMWYENSAEYPWWERLLWSYAWHQCTGQPERTLADLKGLAPEN